LTLPPKIKNKKITHFSNFTLKLVRGCHFGPTHFTDKMITLTTGLGTFLPGIKSVKMDYPIIHFNNGWHWH